MVARTNGMLCFIVSPSSAGPMRGIPARRHCQGNRRINRHYGRMSNESFLPFPAQHIAEVPKIPEMIAGP
jgi:hypothetical protein